MPVGRLLAKGLRPAKWRWERFWGERAINYRGEGVVNLIDIGALGWLPYPWKKRENAVKIRHLLRFEPQERSSRSRNVTTVDAALWETDCQRDFFISAGGGGGSSLFEQNYMYVRENYQELRLRGHRRLAETWFERSRLERVIKVECRTLDGVLGELDRPFRYHFLKIDAQGAEYEILKGAEKFLRTSCVGLHLELLTLPLLKGAKLLPEVVAYLDSFGFELTKKYPAHGTFDSQHDCLFLKRRLDDRIMDTVRSVYELI